MPTPADQVKVLIISTDVKTGEETGPRRCIDHNRPEDREWLAKHCWWAARSGVAVLSKPLIDPEESK